MAPAGRVGVARDERGVHTHDAGNGGVGGGRRCPTGEGRGAARPLAQAAVDHRRAGSRRRRGLRVVAALAPDPNAQLLRDLPLLENLDQYKAVGSIEFLRALEANNPFPKEPETAQAASSHGAGETIAQRRQLVTAMTAKESEELFDNEKSFLDPQENNEQRRRLRELYAEIQGDANRDKLLALMNRYWEWYSAQSHAVRNEQQQLEPAKRLAALKKELEKGTITGNEIHLDEESRAGLVRWMDFYTTQHEARILQDWARRGGLGRPFGGPLRPSPTVRLEGDPAAKLAAIPPQRKREIVPPMAAEQLAVGKCGPAAADFQRRNG